MAKRTNKTDHVLNLLSGNKKEVVQNEEARQEPPVDPKKKESVHVSVVNHSADDESPIAESVKNSLEEEMERYVESKKVSELPQEQEKSVETEAHLEEPESTEEPEPPEEMPSQEIATQESLSEAEPEEVFTAVNVMERLVRDKAEGYMKQFGNCTCSRCVEDTVALALTNLPSKYVVVNRDAVSPLLNFYEKQYAGQITVEITKACIKVKENPRH
ncbi:late competence development ComFB family protein [Zhenpiania hominis]|uniref:Late competence development ComFB family protein n=1 Tax=Zhenpiania hominis TaxID=2763644 RepID=A0A923NJR8_9FIRM|nr:late competence development ComFB family protein [Zhenpiania hominis]MBC6678334.1 late competence development ComFB family protein [Zhenpiania hominis]